MGMPYQGFMRFGWSAVVLFLLWILQFVVFGCLTMKIAREKGRDAAGWFFIGGILGFVGLVAALIMLPAEYYQKRDTSGHPPAV